MSDPAEIKKLGEKIGEDISTLRKTVEDMNNEKISKSDYDEKMEKVTKALEESKERADNLEAAVKRAQAQTEVAEENKDIRDEWNNFQKRHGLHLTMKDDEIGVDGYKNFKGYFNKSLRMKPGNRPGDPKYCFELTADEMKATDLLTKALSGQTDSGGGLLLPEIEESALMRQLRIANPIRDYCSVVAISDQAYKSLWQRGSGAVTWVSETEARNDTAGNTYAELEYDVREMHATPKATQNLIDDARYDVGAIIVDEVGATMGIEEAKVITTGTGAAAKQPLGLLSATIETDSGKRAAEDRDVDDFFAIQTAGTFGAQAPTKLLDMFGELPREYRSNSRFFMHRKTWVECMKLMNSDKDYLLQWDPRNPIKFMLWGYPVVEIDDMPSDVSVDGTILIGFGNMKAAYQIIDRQGLRVLVDPYTDKPYVKYYCTRRMGGGPRDGASMIFLKKSA